MRRARCWVAGRSRSSRLRADRGGAARAEQALAASVLVGNGCSGACRRPRSRTHGRALHHGGATHELRFSDGARCTAGSPRRPRRGPSAAALEEPVTLKPLAPVRQLPIAGTVSLRGQPEPSALPRGEARAHRSLSFAAAAGGALFTTIDGIPGDSGALIVDAATRVVGSYGGAQCHIATPSDTLRRLIADVCVSRPGRRGSFDDLRSAAVRRPVGSPDTLRGLRDPAVRRPICHLDIRCRSAESDPRCPSRPA